MVASSEWAVGCLESLSRDPSALLEICNCCDCSDLFEARATSRSAFPGHVVLFCLKHRLRHPAWEQRAEAVWSLRWAASKGDKLVLLAVIEQLATDEDCSGGPHYAVWFNQRAFMIMRAKAGRGDADVVSAAIRCTKHGNEDTRAAAIGALGSVAQKDDAESILSIAACLEDSDEDVQEAVLHTLVYDRMVTAGSWCATVVGGLVEFITDHQHKLEHRIDGVQALTEWASKGDADAVRCLTVCLQEGHDRMVSGALEGLGKLAMRGDTTVINSVSSFLTEHPGIGAMHATWFLLPPPDAARRHAAVHVLGDLVEDADASVQASTIVVLATCLGDPDWEVRHSAAIQISILASSESSGRSWASSVNAYVDSPDVDIGKKCQEILDLYGEESGVGGADSESEIDFDFDQCLSSG